MQSPLSVPYCLVIIAALLLSTVCAAAVSLEERVARLEHHRDGFANAFVSRSRTDTATVQIGQFRMPVGYEHLTSAHKTFTIELSLANNLLTVSRLTGASGSGAVIGQRLAYSVGAFNGDDVNSVNKDNLHNVSRPHRRYRLVA